MTSRQGLALFFGLPVTLFAFAYVAIARATPRERVVAAVPSSDGRRVATVVRVEGVPPVVAVRVGDADAFVAYGCSGATVRWRDAGTLEVAFGHAARTETGHVAGLRVVALGAVREQARG